MKAAWLGLAGVVVLAPLVTFVLTQVGDSGPIPDQTAQSTSGPPSISPSAESPPPSSPEAATTAAPPSNANTSSSPPTAGWYYLADFDTVDGYGINVDTVPIEVNGVTYYHPVHWPAGYADRPYYAEWNLSRKCVQFTSPGTGIDDDAPVNYHLVFTVLTDGTDRWHREIRLGQKYEIRLPINNALRIRLAVAAREGGNGPEAVWGDAKVWCNSEPPNRKK